MKKAIKHKKIKEIRRSRSYRRALLHVALGVRNGMSVGRGVEILSNVYVGMDKVAKKDIRKAVKEI